MKRIIQKIDPRNWNKSIEIPVVRLFGVIASSNMSGIMSQNSFDIKTVEPALKRAFSRKKAPAVAIIINSPGGSPVQSNMIFSRIRQLADENKKRVLVFSEDAAASGGYMIALAGDEIIVDPSSIIGSIGVVSAGFGFVDMIAKIGVERRVHTAGTNKRLLDPFMNEKQEDIEHLHSIQADIHTMFIDMVKQRRDKKLKADFPDMFSGLFWTGTKAVDLGLADKTGNVYDELKSRYGKDVRVKDIAVGKSGLLQKLFKSSSAGFSFAPILDELRAYLLWMRLGL